MAEVQKQLGDECVITNIITRPYGWVFCYTSREYVETGDEDLGLIGNAPFFISKCGESARISTASFCPYNLFFKNWEASHPECELPNYEDKLMSFNSILVLSEEDEKEIVRTVQTILRYSIDFHATLTRFEVDVNQCRFRIYHLKNETWQKSLLGNYYALVAQRIKQMADIAPREKQSSETQTGTINLTLEEKKYRVTVTSTISEKREELHLAFESQ